MSDLQEHAEVSEVIDESTTSSHSSSSQSGDPTLTESSSMPETASSLPSTDEYGEDSMDVADIDALPSNGTSLYDITFDNVNQKVHVRHHTRGKRTDVLNMVQAYATKDRVPSLHLDDSIPSADSIRDIPIENILPNAAEDELYIHELSTLVERVLVTNMACFEPLADSVEKHIKHMYTEESSRPSEVVSVITYIVLKYSSNI